jgi:hypothetical protein
MFLAWRAGLVSTTVTLVVDHGVGLKDAELWRLEGETYVALPPPALTASSAVWAGVAPVPGEASLVLQLYWIAFDPMKPVWRYNAVVTVVDQAGSKLKGAHGHSNPASIPRDLAANWDHGQEPVVVS